MKAQWSARFLFTANVKFVYSSAGDLFLITEPYDPSLYYYFY